MNARRVTVTSTPGVLVDARMENDNLIVNRGADSFFVGATDEVTTADGFEVAPGEGLAVTIGGKTKVYAVADVTTEAHVLEGA